MALRRRRFRWPSDDPVRISVRQVHQPFILAVICPQALTALRSNRPISVTQSEPASMMGAFRDARHKGIVT
jgi:hypothetical protein